MNCLLARLCFFIRETLNKQITKIQIHANLEKGAKVLPEPVTRTNLKL